MVLHGVRVQVKDAWDKGLSYCALHGVHSIHFTTCYKHRGSLFDGSLSVMPEIKMRVCSARAGAVALRRSTIFSAQHVALDARVMLFQSLAGTKLTFQVGIWKQLRIKECRAWGHGTLALHRMLLPDSQRHVALSWFLHSLCGCLGVPHPHSSISVAVCRVFDHLARSYDEGSGC